MIEGLEDGRIYIQVSWGGKRYKYAYMIDPELLAEHLISWRTREEADIRRIAGDPFAMINLGERTEKRRKLIEHLGGLCGLMLADVFDKIEKTP